MYCSRFFDSLDQHINASNGIRVETTIYQAFHSVLGCQGSRRGTNLRIDTPCELKACIHEQGVITCDSSNGNNIGGTAHVGTGASSSSQSHNIPASTMVRIVSFSNMALPVALQCPRDGTETKIPWRTLKRKATTLVLGQYQHMNATFICAGTWRAATKS